MNKNARIGLIAFGTIFTMVLIYALWLLIFSRTPSLAVSKDYNLYPQAVYSPVVKDSVRFFNGRNFIEVNLQDGASRQLLPSDGFFPSMEVVSWSQDAQSVVFKTKFHSPNDVMAVARSEQKASDRQEILWVLNLNTKQYVALPEGYEAAFSTNSPDTMYLVESISSIDYAHVDSSKIAEYSLLSKSIIWIDSIDDVPLSIDQTTSKNILSARNSSTGSIVLYELQDGAVSRLPFIEDATTVTIGRSGVIAFSPVDFSSKQIELTVGVTTIFDSDLREVKKYADVSELAEFSIVDDSAILSYSEDTELLMRRYYFAEGRDRLYATGSIEGDDATNVLVGLTSSSNKDTLYAIAGNTVRYVGDFNTEGPGLSSEIADYAALADTLTELPYLGATINRQGVIINNFKPLTSSDYQEISRKIEATGVDPNLVSLIFSNEY